MSLQIGRNCHGIATYYIQGSIVLAKQFSSLLLLGLLLFAMLAIGPAAVQAEGFADADEPVKVELISEHGGLPKEPFWVAVRLSVAPSWHAYWKNPGDAGMPLTLSWELPPGFSVDQLLWPTPKRFSLASATGFGYDEEVVMLARIVPPSSNWTAPVTLGVEMRWVVCSDQECLPGASYATLMLPAEAPPASFFAHARSRLPQHHEGFLARREGSSILLSLPKELAAGAIAAADFFPEERETVDYSSKVALNVADNASDVSLIANAGFESLKGILVLETSQGTHAFDVDIPVAGSAGADEIALAKTRVGDSTSFDYEASEALPKPALADMDFSFQGGVALAVLLAFVGGLLLNLMPCVLPVISFKILGFIKLAGQSRRLILQHGIAFSGGVLVAFWILAAFLLLLQSYGHSVGWGFQLQEPLFVAILAALIFAFALSLFGVFEMGTSLIGVGSQMTSSKGHTAALTSSFLSGMLATVVATPCTGPFLGSAVGFAVTLPSFQAFIIFSSLGLGMALPYLLLAAFPGLLSYMPKPGPWMVTFKEIMGFFMLATTLWLLWVFNAQTSALALMVLLASFFMLAIAGWVYGKWATPSKPKGIRQLGRAIALLFLGLGSYAALIAAELPADVASNVGSAHEISYSIEDWQPFSPAKVEELRLEGVPVFIDFTAKWCLICQANHLVLSSHDVVERFKELGIVKMKADWTRYDEVITAELSKFGRNSVPLYLLYGNEASQQVQILPQVLTVDSILAALEQLERR